MSRTVWDAPSASSKKEVSFKPETEVGYVTSNCMGHAVHQFEKEVSLRLGTGVEYVAWNCMGHAVRQFDKEVSFKLGKGVEMLHRTVWDAPSARSKRKLVLVYKQE